MRNSYAIGPNGHYALSEEEQAMCERVANRLLDLPAVSQGKDGRRLSIEHEDESIGRVAWIDALSANSINTVELLFHYLSRATAFGGAVNETNLNAALDMLVDLKPTNSAELMLATQIVTMHVAYLEVASAAATSESALQQEWSLRMMVSTSKAFASQLETFRRLRTVPQQIVRVEHVHLHAASATPGGAQTFEGEPHVRSIPERGAVHCDLKANKEEVPRSRGARK